MANRRNDLVDLTDRPRYRDRSWEERAAKGTRRAGRRIAKFDVAIGPLELAATYAIFGLAGLWIGVKFSRLIPGAWSLPFLALGGLVAGLLLAIPARGLSLGGSRIGIIGATLLALLALIVAGQIEGGVTSVRSESKFREACLAYQAEGLAMPDACKEELAKPAVSVERGLRTSFKIVLTIVMIAGAVIGAVLLIAFLRTGNWHYGAILLGAVILLLLLFFFVGRIW